MSKATFVMKCDGGFTKHLWSRGFAGDGGVSAVSLNTALVDPWGNVIVSGVYSDNVILQSEPKEIIKLVKSDGNHFVVKLSP